MKKMICLLAALLLMTSCALAEEYVTLAELREQAKAGWNQTYTAKGREVIANAEMDWFPEADTCPLVSVDPLAIDEDDERLDKWRDLPHGEFFEDLPDRVIIRVKNHNRYQLAPIGSWTGKRLVDQYSFYDGEIPDRQPEDCDITFEEFMEMFEADMLAITGLSLEDIHIDEIKLSSPQYKGKKLNGEYVRGDKLTAAGDYYVRAKQLIEGIPVLGSFRSLDKGRMEYSYYMSDYYDMLFWAVTNPEIVKEDLPLLSFDVFKSKLEKLIDAGKLRGVDGMRFGYGVCKDGKKWKLVPVWMVTCGYTDNPNNDKKVMPYIAKDGRLVSPNTYGEYYFNAQTGEMMETYTLNRYEDSLRMPKKILTWDDVN